MKRTGQDLFRKLTILMILSIHGYGFQITQACFYLGLPSSLTATVHYYATYDFYTRYIYTKVCFDFTEQSLDEVNGKTSELEKRCVLLSSYSDHCLEKGKVLDEFRRRIEGRISQYKDIRRFEE